MKFGEPLTLAIVAAKALVLHSPNKGVETVQSLLDAAARLDHPDRDGHTTEEIGREISIGLPDDHPVLGLLVETATTHPDIHVRVALANGRAIFRSTHEEYIRFLSANAEFMIQEGHQDPEAAVMLGYYLVGNMTDGFKESHFDDRQKLERHIDWLQEYLPIYERIVEGIALLPGESVGMWAGHMAHLFDDEPNTVTVGGPDGETEITHGLYARDVMIRTLERMPKTPRVSKLLRMAYELRLTGDLISGDSD